VEKKRGLLILITNKCKWDGEAPMKKEKKDTRQMETWESP